MTPELLASPIDNPYRQPSLVLLAPPYRLPPTPLLYSPSRSTFGVSHDVHTQIATTPPHHSHPNEARQPPQSTTGRQSKPRFPARAAHAAPANHAVFHLADSADASLEEGLRRRSRLVCLGLGDPRRTRRDGIHHGRGLAEQAPVLSDEPRHLVRATLFRASLPRSALTPSSD